MMRTALLLTVSFLTLGTTSANANYFVWADPDTGASLSYPDTWKMIANQKPDDLLTIVGPSSADQPICRLRAREEKRFTVYPVWYSRDVQRVSYNQDFWNAYTAEYDNVTLVSYTGDAGLGKAFASSAVVNYTSATPKEDNKLRTAQLWGGVYYDTAYILDCSARSGGFRAWVPDFASIAKSVDMSKIIHELTIGDYPRNFINDRYLTHPIMNGPDHMGQTYN